MFDFFKYPHTDLNQQNLGWLIDQMKNLVEDYKSYKNPVVVSYADQMTDTNKIYIYVGSETGYLSDYWYYYDDDTRTWIAGGIYGTDALPSIDPTLTLSGHPADAKAVGDAIAAVAAYEALNIDIAAFSSFPVNVSNSAIKSDMRVISCVFGTPSAILSPITWTTSNGSLTLSGTINGTTTATVIMAKTN